MLQKYHRVLRRPAGLWRCVEGRCCIFVFRAHVPRSRAPDRKIFNGPVPANVSPAPSPINTKSLMTSTRCCEVDGTKPKTSLRGARSHAILVYSSFVVACALCAGKERNRSTSHSSKFHVPHVLPAPHITHLNVDTQGESAVSRCRAISRPWPFRRCSLFVHVVCTECRSVVCTCGAGGKTPAPCPRCCTAGARILRVLTKQAEYSNPPVARCWVACTSFSRPAGGKMAENGWVCPLVQVDCHDRPTKRLPSLGLMVKGLTAVEPNTR